MAWQASARVANWQREALRFGSAMNSFDVRLLSLDVPNLDRLLQ
jgi:hypothetical protein